jgi:hypothetical protein
MDSLVKRLWSNKKPVLTEMGSSSSVDHTPVVEEVRAEEAGEEEDRSHHPPPLQYNYSRSNLAIQTLLSPITEAENSALSSPSSPTGSLLRGRERLISTVKALISKRKEDDLPFGLRVLEMLRKRNNRKSSVISLIDAMKVEMLGEDSDRDAKGKKMQNTVGDAFGFSNDTLNTTSSNISKDLANAAEEWNQRKAQDAAINEAAAVKIEAKVALADLDRQTHVIIMEHNKMQLSAMQQSLVSQGLRVSIYEDVDSVVTAAKRQTKQTVIDGIVATLDHNYDNAEVLLNRLIADNMSIPVIVTLNCPSVGEAVENEQLQRCMSARAVGYFLRPIDPREFARQVSQIFMSFRKVYNAVKEMEAIDVEKEFSANSGNKV